MIYIIVVLLAVCQVTLANLISVGNIKPDFLLILVVFVALYKGPLKAAAIGVLAGFSKDVISTGTFLNTFAFWLTGIVVGIFVEKFRFHKENLLAQSAIVLSASIFVSLVYLVWFLNWDYPLSIFALAIHIGIPTVLYTTVITPFIFALLRKVTNVTKVA